MSLVKGKNIDISAVDFSVPKSLDNGAKLVYVNYDNGRFSVQTPWMTMPWKMGVYTDGDYPKYSVDLSFKGMDENPDLQGFHDKFKALEEKLIQGGINNSVPWFKKPKISRDGVVEKFNPIIKDSRDKETGEPDGKWPPTMKLKVPRRDGTWECKVVNKDDRSEYKINDVENPDNLEDVFIKNTKVRAIIQCVGIWIASGNYMRQWKLQRAEVEVPTTYSNDDFIDDSDVEDGVEHNFVEDSDDDSGGADNTKVEEPDADASEHEADSTEPDVDATEPEVVSAEPEKTKKKVVVRRKKKTSD